MSERVDVFCQVVDNFGDVGVCWRLARQLAAEHGLQVRLWVDNLETFHRIEPGARRDLDQQDCRGVNICRWPAEWPDTDAADLVLEAFGCDLPTAYVKAMANRQPPCLWINLEYLSAEPWVNAYHGLPSLQPGGQEKYFFFPGFTSRSGGLIRETGLIQRRQKFQNDKHARQAFLDRIGVHPTPAARLVSLFCYENASLTGWLDALANGPAPIHLLVPEGRILDDLSRWAEKTLLPGMDVIQGNLAVSVLQFMSQDDYDQLLWCCDFNLVRGEDSFLRAQWAGKPFIWQIYPQADGAHLEKLNAFLELYCRDLAPAARDALLAASLAWNTGQSMTAGWASLEAMLPALNGHAEHWCLHLAEQTNISQALVNFYRNWI